MTTNLKCMKMTEKKALFLVYKEYKNNRQLNYNDKCIICLFKSNKCHKLYGRKNKENSPDSYKGLKI